ncbi:MAG: DUF4115 domain-containing protein [Betaproteobacteria bacterium]|nr:DUF4115 domain-containing protein [Betaproteobacteria bacterium]
MIRYLASSGNAPRSDSTATERGGKKTETKRKSAKSSEGSGKTSRATAKTVKKKVSLWEILDRTEQEDIPVVDQLVPEAHQGAISNADTEGIGKRSAWAPETGIFSRGERDMKEEVVSLDTSQPSAAPASEHPEPALPSTAQGIGAMLCAAREKKGLSLAAMSRLLRLSHQQVEALERGEWDKLPGQTFIRGFARNYARETDLDPESLRGLLDRVLAFSDQQELELAPASSVVLLERDERQRSNYFLILLGLGFLVGIILAYFFIPGYFWDSSLMPQGGKTASTEYAENITAHEGPEIIESEQPPLSVATGEITANAESAPIPASPDQAADASATPVAANTAGMAQLEFSFAENAWVEIRDKDDKVIFSRLNEAGTSQTIAAKSPLALVVGNAGQVSLTLDGKKIQFPPPSRDGVARFRIE